MVQVLPFVLQAAAAVGPALLQRSQKPSGGDLAGANAAVARQEQSLRRAREEEERRLQARLQAARGASLGGLFFSPGAMIEGSGALGQRRDTLG